MSALALFWTNVILFFFAMVCLAGTLWVIYTWPRDEDDVTHIVDRLEQKAARRAINSPGREVHHDDPDVTP